MGLAAAALLGTLVFLFLRTESANYKAEAHALSLVRELKDHDTRWDIDALRLADSLATPAPAVPDRSPVFMRILQELEQRETRSVLGNIAPTLRAGILEKQEAFRRLRDLHGQTLQSLLAAREALTALAAEAPAARARNPRAGEAAIALATQAEAIRAAIRVADVEQAVELQRSIEPPLSTLVPAAQAVDPALATAAARAEAATRAFLRARGAEADAWNRFSRLSVGARIDLAARDLTTAIDNALVEKDRWRAYLIAYAAALLIGLAYLAMRLIQADAALRKANQELEQRVMERTSDLSSALRQLKESEAQLVQTEKMSSLGQLVAGVVHEINTPLAYVKSNVGSVQDRMPEVREVLGQARSLLAMLQDGETDPETLRAAFADLSERLRRLEEEALLEDLEALMRDGVHGIDQISELVTNLRNFSRLDRSKIASFNVNDGVTTAFLIARPLLRKIDVERNLAEIPAITCSPSQVNQVVLNLVTNAAQAIDKPRGLISVTTRREGADAVAIEIADNGKGIDEASLPRIFDPFFTTKAPGSGTGLGLSIAYKIVAQHGGRIDVRSAVGLGSTFTVVLPIEPPPDLAQVEAGAATSVA